jgi:hypothetical protein
MPKFLSAFALRHGLDDLHLSKDGGDLAKAVIKQASYLGHVIEYLLASGPQFLRALELRRRRAIPLEEARRTIFARTSM